MGKRNVRNYSIGRGETENMKPLSRMIDSFRQKSYGKRKIKMFLG